MIASCLGFQVDCAILTKGALAVVVAFILFIGSIYLLLAAVFGRRMGYLVLAVSFFGWMILFSATWTFGFFSQDRKSTRLNSSHIQKSRMPSSA